ncbi:MAG: glycosyltransferase family 2 protein [Planctomycetes bacterium]|nr:glycosyltransferase family 2 protein [Planctomycetota bacterium]
MMSALIAVIFVGTICFAIWQARLIRGLFNLYSRPVREWSPDIPFPNVAIILSLRGHDPFLNQCLRNLVRQDYPEFSIHLIVDSESDPAWDAIRTVREEFGEDCLNASVLHEHLPTCGLKNSSLIQAIGDLPQEVEVVAMVDSDSIVPVNWLRSLVGPFADPAVGATSGIRWFAPNDQHFGSRLRCFWNIIAAPMICKSNIPWGGSMMIRRSILDSGLTDEWSRMLCDDAPTINYLRRTRYKLEYVPQMTIVNTESISVRSCIRFVSRQKLIFRLYQADWPRLVATILCASILRITHDILLVMCVVQQEITNAAILACLHPVILFATCLEAIRLDRAISAVARNRGEDIKRTPLPGPVGYIGVELLFLMSMLTSIFTRSVIWRGIKYRIRGPEDITMLEYHRYVVPVEVVLHSESIV